MGKRELVLIALFLVAGMVVYQVTAPPAPPGSDLSVGGIFQRMRRQMQGARETATGESRQTVPVPAGTTAVRIGLPRPCDVTITGADREDIAIEIRATARGYTQDEAKTAAGTATVKVLPSGDTLALTGVWEDRRGPAGYVTQVAITIAVPRRLALRINPHIGTLLVTDVASVEGQSSRGETRITGVAGDVTLTHISGALEVSGVGSLKLTSRSSRGEISKFGVATKIEATGSRLRLSGLGGTLEVESRKSELTLAEGNALKPPMRYNGVEGSLRIEGLKTEARIDGRNTDLDVRLAAPAPVTIYNLGAILVTAPPGGYTLDAVASEGRITSEDSDITATPSNGADARASAKIRGGGPALTLRATRGRIEVRKPAGR